VPAAAVDTTALTSEPLQSASSCSTPTGEVQATTGVDGESGASVHPAVPATADLLPHVYGSLRDSETVRNDELARMAERLAPSRVPSREVARRSALQSVSLDARSQAVSLLLGTPTDKPQEQPSVEMERDWMMGCLVAGFCDPGTQAAAIVAVADRFTAAGKLSLAVPMLFLIGRGADACRRLQEHGRWEYAATLAKTSLPAAERSGVLTRWADHLLCRGEQHRAIEVLLSLGRVQDVSERLLETAAFDKAALLLCALREAHEARRGALAGFSFRGAARVLLSRISLNDLAEHYTRLACTTKDAPPVASGGEAEEALSKSEAAQLVVQLARLQERREMQQ
jgi:hypothetical protein